MRTLEVVVWVVALVWLGWSWWQVYGSLPQGEDKRNRRQQRLKARSPEDCPACQGGQGLRTVNGVAPRAVRAWSERKGQGGRKKRSDTQAYPQKTP